MSIDPAHPQSAAVRAALGEPGRMLSFSKTRYQTQYPDHVCVFNANVCLDERKVWWGDLDLTRDEPKLLELAAATGAAVFVLYEQDGRFQREAEPLLERAIYSATGSGHNRFEHAYLERAADGTLRRRPPPPDTRKRFVLTFGRPRLLRLGQREIVTNMQQAFRGEERSTLVYIGERPRQTPGTPLLVLGSFRRTGYIPLRGLEITWYPTPKKHAPRPLINLGFEAPRGRTGPYLNVRAHPGQEYRLLAGLARRVGWH